MHKLRISFHRRHSGNLVATFLLLFFSGWALAQPGGAGELARAYAGLDQEQSGKEAKAAYRKTVNASWLTYQQRIAKPMSEWAKKEIAFPGGNTIFYPFSGPDLVTVVQLFPDAERYVLVAMQKARAPVDIRALADAERRAFNDKFNTEWRKFGTLGYFRTNDLDEDSRNKQVRIGITPILMAFAARLGYDVIEVSPIALSAETGDFEKIAGQEDGAWDSVRITLSKAGKKVNVDYVRMNLSDSAFKSRERARAWIERMAANPVLLKAASHLLQEPGFSVVRDAIVTAAPIVVQDETGLEFEQLGKIGEVSLYGGFTRSHKLFVHSTQHSLAVAYRNTRKVGELPFAFSYNKASNQRSMQIAKRKNLQQKAKPVA